MSAPRVVVVGSINVDLVVTADRLPAAGETVAGGRFARFGGGKGANQAVAAARVGAAVSFVGAVGDDEMGAEAVAGLESEGIDVARVARLSSPTGVALIVVDSAGENQIAVASGANAALVVEELELPGEGVVLLNHEVSEDVVVAAARAAADAGWQVVLNPAPARSLPDVRVAVVTPNASEAAELTGCDDPSEAASALAEQTGAAVLITLGASGALLLEPGGAPQRLPRRAWTSSTPPAPVTPSTARWPPSSPRAARCPTPPASRSPPPPCPRAAREPAAACRPATRSRPRRDARPRRPRPATAHRPPVADAGAR